ncbi:hypothetical protein [Aestuariimicrobium kwangyangense]|uniref:hypothetical protein n=1 Tax=Aestuariimicrobium kwangyangense TaxID=396389 RepID=UPI0012F722B7|nr:hypothetical protein [Aestuariimicrobium kwangyangense]
MPHPPLPHPVPSPAHVRLRHRGVSLSAFSAVVAVAVLLMAGLVVDGGAKAADQRESEAIAARAARVGVDAGAVAGIQGRPGATQVVAAARASLREQGREGSVTMLASGVLSVQVHHRTPTTFLTLVGITELSSDGEAAAQLRQR